jgi:acetyltransferase-like isoleucine patch superfamily enzyme
VKGIVRLARAVDPAPYELTGRVAQWTLPPAVVRDPGPPLLEIGTNSATPGIIQYLGETGSVRIGKWCSIEQTARIFVGGEHPTDFVSLYPFRLTFGMEGLLKDGIPSTKGPVVIGNDVWLGWESLVKSGVTIGDGAIVGTRAVVTHDVEPYSIVAGVPARHVRWRFEAHQREALLRIAWWDWPEEKIRQYVPQLLSNDVEGFIQAHDPRAH